MKINAMLTLVTCSLLAVACSKNNSTPGSAGSPITGTETPVEQLVPVAEPIAPSGDTVSTSKRVGEPTVTVVSGTMSDLETLKANFPEIARDVATAESIDRIVTTSAGTWDLYAADRLMVTLEKQGDVYAVRQSADMFTPQMIEVGTVTDSSEVHSFAFVIHACRMVQPEQVVVEEDKQEGQDQKGEDQEEQEPTPAPVEECSDVRVDVAVEPVIVPVPDQEEEQKDDGEEQEEGKTPIQQPIP